MAMFMTFGVPCGHGRGPSRPSTGLANPVLKGLHLYLSNSCLILAQCGFGIVDQLCWSWIRSWMYPYVVMYCSHLLHCYHHILPTRTAPIATPIFLPIGESNCSVVSLFHFILFHPVVWEQQQYMALQAPLALMEYLLFILSAMGGFLESE